MPISIPEPPPILREWQQYDTIRWRQLEPGGLVSIETEGGQVYNVEVLSIDEEGKMRILFKMGTSYKREMVIDVVQRITPGLVKGSILNFPDLFTSSKVVSLGAEGIIADVNEANLEQLLQEIRVASLEEMKVVLGNDFIAAGIEHHSDKHAIITNRLGTVMKSLRENADFTTEELEYIVRTVIERLKDTGVLEDSLVEDQSRNPPPLILRSIDFHREHTRYLFSIVIHGQTGETRYVRLQHMGMAGHVYPIWLRLRSLLKDRSAFYRQRQQ